MRVEGEERRKGGIMTDSLGAIWNMGGDSPKKSGTAYRRKMEETVGYIKTLTKYHHN